VTVGLSGSSEQALRPGEIRIEGLGKRYWVGPGSTEREQDEALDGAVADPDADAEDGDAVSFFRRRTELWALREIDCHIAPGERVAVVGANGSGKSTLIRILSRLLPPSEGVVEGGGIVVPFAALRSPLSPQLSGRDNLRLLARLLEIPRERLEERLPEIVRFSDLGPMADEKVSRYSDGSYVRLSSAMGLLIGADIFLVDDSLKVGDEVYREKFETKLSELLDGKVTLVYASNSLHVLRVYCQRALLLERGRLIADGPVHAVIQRFVTKGEGVLEFDDLARPEAVEDDLASADSDSDQVAAAAAPREPGTVAFPADRLTPMQDWLNQVKRAERAWQKVIKRWRAKAYPKDARNMGHVVIRGECTLGVIHTFWCMTPDGQALRRLLPGEAVALELLVETFEPDVTVAVRLELDAGPVIAWVSEPLVPLLATKPGQYLFRTAIDEGFSGYSYENTLLKIRMRTMFERPGADRREMVSSTIQLHLRGDVRAQFDEQRRLAGEPATSIVNPTPAYVEPPEQIPGFDPGLDFTPQARTRWQNLNRRPALRPRLKWMVYRVAAASIPQPEAEPVEPALEPASP
jgi:ABC-type polysaccharide/polyol phosphate transport system ATPase subunit